MKELPKVTALTVRKENILKIVNPLGEDGFRKALAMFSTLEDSLSLLAVTVKCTALLQDLFLNLEGKPKYTYLPFLTDVLK